MKNIESVLGPLVLHVSRSGSLPAAIAVPEPRRREDLSEARSVQIAQRQISWPELWEKAPRWRQVAVDDGSENQRALVCALALWHPATREEALEAWRIWAEINRTIGYQGCEPDSRIYGAWTLCAHLLAYRWFSATHEGSQEFRLNLAGYWEFLRDYLSLWWARRRLALWSSPVGPWSLHPGSRSGGHGLLQTPADYADSLAGLGATPWVWRNGRSLLGRSYGANRFWSKGEAEMWVVPALEALREEIWGTAAIARDLLPGTDRPARLLEALGETARWPCLNRVNYFRTDMGLACWCESAGPGEDAVVNSNTSGVAAMGWGEGDSEPWGLPKGGGPRIRQRVVEIVEREDDESGRPVALRFSAGVPGHREIEVARRLLPRGEVLLWMLHDKDGIRIVREYDET